MGKSFYCVLCGAQLIGYSDCYLRCPYCKIEFDVDMEGEFKEINWKERT
jgi:hypothetical protein